MRASPGWDRVTVERCKMWLGPLEAARNGFAAGVVAGENAIDTKTPATGRSTLVVRDTVAYGFGGGLIANMAAFNMKENVDALFDRVTVHSSQIGFRVRNPASVTVRNTVLYGIAGSAVRYEDDVPVVTLVELTVSVGAVCTGNARGADDAPLPGSNTVICAVPATARSLDGIDARN